jgi:2-keto-4-pentenoate hydratase/2-oxohepta-3-ene-1,7-dioic acid hydratase in catechol pathway
MIRQALTFLRFALSIALTVGIVLSSSAQSQSHNLAKITEIMTQHQVEIKDHGHAHEDIVDVMHAYQEHAHEMADHDHNSVFLPPKRGTGFIAPARTNWSLTEITMSDRSVFGLDRPPRA